MKGQLKINWNLVAPSTCAAAVSYRKRFWSSNLEANFLSCTISSKIKDIFSLHSDQMDWKCYHFFPLVILICMRLASLVFDNVIERHDQGHLHPKVEVPGLTCSSGDQTWASAVGGKRSRKEPFDQPVNGYLEHLHIIKRQCTCSPLTLFYTRGLGIVLFDV